MKNIGLFENSSKPLANKYAEKAAEIILKGGAECCASPELLETFPPGLAEKVKSVPIDRFEDFADVVISFGGDGTMLSASHAFIGKNLPIMGINVGKLGFLAEFSVANLQKSIEQLFNGNYRIIDRSVIETQFEGKTYHALNDFVFEKTGSSRVITITAFANDSLIANYNADGLIVATPTGSTAYSLSCSGPIIVPPTEVICLTPISPHSMTFRPLILPDSVDLRIFTTSYTGKSNFSIDGQNNFDLENGHEVLIKKSQEKIKLIKPFDNSFYDLLRKKLLWSASAVGEEQPTGADL